MFAETRWGSPCRCMHGCLGSLPLYSASVCPRHSPPAMSGKDPGNPGAAPKEEHTPVAITIANGKTQMDFAGDIYPHPEGDMPTGLPFFNQANLGHPELDQDKWGALENRVFDLLDSRRPLTISAEGKSYVLPPVNVPRWRARFQKIC